MRKKIGFLFILMFLLVLSACNAESDYIDNTPDDNEEIVLTANDIPERKIIYTVNSSFDVNDLNQSVATLKTLVNSDEWFDLEEVGSSHATFTVRIKTERLDEFTNELKANFQVRTFTKQGKDISLQYQDKTNRIASINLQITRLQELYAEATLSEMIVINQQLSDLEVELMNLEGELSLFDSLVEYSEVNITFYGSVVVTRSPFFNRVANGFVTGFRAVVFLLDALAIVVIHVIPFALVFCPIGFGIYYFRKKHIAKKKFKTDKGE